MLSNIISVQRKLFYFIFSFNLYIAVMFNINITYFILYNSSQIKPPDDSSLVPYKHRIIKE